MSIKQRILDHIGCPELGEEHIKLIADPHHDGVWAARVEADFYLPDFIIYPDDIEEGEFKSWPPSILN